MSAFLEGVHLWVLTHTGQWGVGILALVMVVVAYGLVWHALSTVRRSMQLALHPPAGRARSGAIVSGIFWSGLALGLLVWFLLAAVKEFPAWLGL
jgi:hypothetical protein